MGFVNFCDRVSELASAPIFSAVDDAVTALDNALVAFDHTGHLIALIWVH
jgi:hypothetical protein